MSLGLNPKGLEVKQFLKQFLDPLYSGMSLSLKIVKISEKVVVSGQEKHVCMWQVPYPKSVAEHCHEAQLDIVD